MDARFDEAEELTTHCKYAEAEVIFKDIVVSKISEDDSDAVVLKERAVYRLAEIYTRSRDAQGLIDLLLSVRPYFDLLPKAKTAKLVRKLFDAIFAAGASTEAQESLCKDMVEWARAQKQTFLRQRLQHRLAEVQFLKHDALAAQATIAPLLKEVRRLDDKSLLVEIHLLESKVYYAVQNISKARAALVAARTNANAIYCSPLSQAEIDLQSGILHAEEKDYKTAFSYLFEAFEGFHSLGDHAVQARVALKYMLLAKISSDNLEELAAVLVMKNVLEYVGRDIDALREVAHAYKQRDTHAFNKVLEEYKAELMDDRVVQRHLSELYDQLLQKHMLKVIEPYSRVQIGHVASLLNLAPQQVEERLSQMILDHILHGIVDQQNGCLVVYDEEDTASSALLTESLEALANLDKLVTALFDKVAGKFDHLVEEEKKNALQKQKKDKEKDGTGKKDDKANNKDATPAPAKDNKDKKNSGGKSGDKPK